MKRLMFILSLFFICNACTDKNDDVVADESLVGEWVLTDIFCFCAFPENVDYSTSKLLFAANENKVTVVHGNNDIYFHVAGVFNYELDGDIITLEGDFRSYTYTIDGADLTLTFIDEPMIADDEITYKYSKK